MREIIEGFFRLLWRRDAESAFLLMMDLSHKFFTVKDMRHFRDYMNALADSDEHRLAKAGGEEVSELLYDRDAYAMDQRLGD